MRKCIIFLLRGVIINRSNSYGGFNRSLIGLMDLKSQGERLPRLSVSLQMKTNVIDVFGQSPVNSCCVWLMGQQQFVCVCGGEESNSPKQPIAGPNLNQLIDWGQVSCLMKIYSSSLTGIWLAVQIFFRKYD